jgi:hypothetical protein
MSLIDGRSGCNDLKGDPQELHNVAGGLSSDHRAKLHAMVSALKNCHTGAACWKAAK